MQRSGSTIVYPGPRILMDRTSPVLRIDGSAALNEHFAAGIDGALNDQGASLRSAYGLARWRALEVWAGRRGYGLGSGFGSSLVLNDNTPFTGAGLSVPEGVRVPLLRRVYLNGMIARLPDNGPVDHPWFLASRVTVSPHRDVAIGFTRAAIFGGQDSLSITPWRVFLMLIGRPDYPGKDSDFENQVAAVDLLWRTQIADLPLAIHGEWGTDDTGFAFWHVPGLSAGVELLRVPGAAHLSLGVEGVYFGGPDHTYPPWYKHAALADGWSVRGKLLGHSLGGEGKEGALQMQYAVPRVVAQLRGFARERGEENLFAPTRAGRSVGGEVTTVLRVRRLQLSVNAEGERGSGWKSGSLRGSVGLNF